MKILVDFFFFQIGNEKIYSKQNPHCFHCKRFVSWKMTSVLC